MKKYTSLGMERKLAPSAPHPEYQRYQERAEKPSTAPTRSWWLDLDRETFREVAKAETPRMQASKVSGKLSAEYVL